MQGCCRKESNSNPIHSPTWQRWEVLMTSVLQKLLYFYMKKKSKQNKPFSNSETAFILPENHLSFLELEYASLCSQHIPWHKIIKQSSLLLLGLPITSTVMFSLPHKLRFLNKKPYKRKRMMLIQTDRDWKGWLERRFGMHVDGQGPGQALS